jgi:hypothetical protein
MADASRQESGTRLADDLRRIRESKKLSLQDLNNQTKIPVALLTAFEQTALFDHEQFNRVYLRSVVRSYAAAVGISVERSADALDAAFDGAYDGDLGREYLGDAPLPEKPLPAPPRLAEERPSVPGRRIREDDPPKEKRAAVVPPPPAKRDPNADWTSTSPPSRRAATEKVEKGRARRSRNRRTSGVAGWIFAGVGVLLLGALIWFLVGRLGTDDRPADDQLAASDTVESMQADPTPPPVEQRPAVTLGDVMAFYVVAVDGVLDPVRVTVDDDLRRPYWLEHGDSMRFEAQERIVFEERLDRARITVEGYDYPMDRTDAQGRIVISREDARSFFDSGAAF